MTSYTKSIIILIIGICIILPMLYYDSLQSEAYINKTSTDRGLLMMYDTNLSAIKVNFTNPRNDTKAMKITIESGNGNKFENTTEQFPVDVFYIPPDKDQNYKVSTKIITNAGNYTFLYYVTPRQNERKSILDVLFGVFKK